MSETARFGAFHLRSSDAFGAYSTGNEEDSLNGLGVVNLFVGPNNSGKSRFLRRLFKSAGLLHYTTDKYDAAVFRSFADTYLSELQKLSNRGVDKIGKLSIADIEAILTYKGEPRFIKPVWEFPKKVGEVIVAFGPRAADLPVDIRQVTDKKLLRAETRQMAERATREYEGIPWDPSVPSRKAFYIPILRGMRPFKQGGGDCYYDRTASDYFNSDLSTRTEIFTGLGLYSTLKRHLLGQPEQRDDVRRFEKFLSECFFESRPVTLIPVEDGDTVHVQIGKEKQLPIYDLGDGLQNLIILMFNIFLEKKPCLFFIEEPETCMHPGFQRVFLHEITRLDHHQYFITTHSNHLLDMTLDFSDVSVYRFRKETDGESAKFSIQLCSSKDHTVLRDLGVCNSSVFLSNATIWVEGITDRLYLRAFMSKYLEYLKDEGSSDHARFDQFREDCHYSFVEYQGANLEHWAFASEDAGSKRICADVLCAQPFVIADGDIAGKGDRKERLQEALGDRVEILECKEIENLIPQEVVRVVVAGKFKERGKDVASIKYRGYSKSMTGLGRYLDRLLEGETFAVSSGTLKNKMGFCEKAVELMNCKEFEWELPAPLQALCERIFEHIGKHNP